jgi:glycosyltransferase involved in cell wall biosynthesis
MSTPLYTGPVKWMEKKAAANATRVITVSQVSADEIVKYLGFPGDRLHVVPLAAGGDGPGAARQDAGENLVLASGQRRPHKNWAALIRALALVAPEIRPRLIITGARGEDPLRPLVDALGLADWVTLMGWVEDDELAALQDRARAVAMPTLAEGFGLPVLEAMARGLPVLASDLPVLREVGGHAVLYFDPRSTRAIADALRMVATEPERMAELSAAGLARAASFSWRRSAEQTLEVFRAALADPR